MFLFSSKRDGDHDIMMKLFLLYKNSVTVNQKLTAMWMNIKKKNQHRLEIDIEWKQKWFPYRFFINV